MNTPRTDKYKGCCAETHKVEGKTLIRHAETLELELNEARLLAEQFHELVDWWEGYIEIPWERVSD